MSTSDDFRTQDHDELDPELAVLLAAAFHRSVDMEVAARHLWSIDRAARVPVAAQDPASEVTREIPAAPAVAEGARPPDPRAPRVIAARRRSTPRRRALVGVLAAVMLFSTSGAALAASGQALPGDVLYPVKTTGEQARWLLAFSAEDRALVQVEIAQNRLAEAARARAERPDVVAQLIAQAEQAIAQAEQVSSTRVAAAVQVVRTREVAVGPQDLPSRAATPPPAATGLPAQPPIPAASTAPVEEPSIAAAVPPSPPAPPGASANAGNEPEIAAEGTGDEARQEQPAAPASAPPTSSAPTPPMPPTTGPSEPEPPSAVPPPVVETGTAGATGSPTPSPEASPASDGPASAAPSETSAPARNDSPANGAASELAVPSPGTSSVPATEASAAAGAPDAHVIADSGLDVPAREAEDAGQP